MFSSKMVPLPLTELTKPSWKSGTTMPRYSVKRSQLVTPPASEELRQKLRESRREPTQDELNVIHYVYPFLGGSILHDPDHWYNFYVDALETLEKEKE